MYRTVTDSSHLKKLLAVIALAIFIDSLDGSIVNIALPTIAEGFSVDMSTAAWVIMAYFLFLGVCFRCSARLRITDGYRRSSAADL